MTPDSLERFGAPPSLASRAVGVVRTQVKVLGGTLASFWAVLAANTMVSGALLSFGVIPRTLVGLRGILFAPFLHGSVQHLAANTVSFAILGWLVSLRGWGRFAGVTLLSMLGSGLAAWLFGASGSVHVGASGVLFGYLGYLMFSGWFERRFAPIAVSLAVTAAWGGLVFGVLPGAPGISWQMHLGGFLAGAFAARRLAVPPPANP